MSDETVEITSIIPDCTNAGEKELYCLGCGMVIGSQEIPAKGHSAKWLTAEEATCTKYGREEKTCPVCGAAETEEAQHTSFFGRIFYPVIVFFGNIVHKIIWIISLNWLFPELTITPKI